MSKINNATNFNKYNSLRIAFLMTPWVNVVLEVEVVHILGNLGHELGELILICSLFVMFTTFL